MDARGVIQTLIARHQGSGGGQNVGGSGSDKNSVRPDSSSARKDEDEDDGEDDDEDEFPDLDDLVNDSDAHNASSTAQSQSLAQTKDDEERKETQQQHKKKTQEKDPLAFLQGDHIQAWREEHARNEARYDSGAVLTSHFAELHGPVGDASQLVGDANAIVEPQ
eukprot:TRINITY_DN65487_c10_g3_i1.p1 TRINITY_DN65487_c10_g3~~TRINITY_DN65487_c10_g3_i1.p1  ORF type:complete len:164 (+),score=67.53 TRINITY_DN65487_c10_g3_i1:49-540(+)